MQQQIEEIVHQAARLPWRIHAGLDLGDDEAVDAELDAVAEDRRDAHFSGADELSRERKCDS